MLAFLKLRPNLKAWLAGASTSLAVLITSFFWSGVGLGDFLGNFTTEQGAVQAVAWALAQAVVWAFPNSPE